MTKEQILEKHQLTNNVYPTSNELHASLDAMQEYANHQLTAEQESHINMVKQIVELLGFAKCLNILDALEKWQKEREKSAKLVEALENIERNFDCDKDSHRYGTTCRCCLAKQSLTEYKKQ